MFIKNVFMELRSRLRSCNVYITTGIDFSKNCNLKINIQSNCIELNYYDEGLRRRRDSLSSIESLSDCSEDESDVTAMIPIHEYCQIIPNSISCLKIDKTTISFRILTEPKNGSFYKEILSPKTIENSNRESNLKINIKTDTEFKINCGNCSNTISNNVIKFDRILELPSANLDMSEWFCHGHCHGNSTETDIAIKPNKTDFLYRLTFFIVNNNMLSDKTNKFNSNREVYHCNRCLAWLGLKEKDSVKVFNSEISIQENNEDKHVFTHKSSLGNISTDDFIYTIEKVIKEFDLGFQYTVMTKIVLECKISASSKQYLLIWVMDKELQVLRNINNIMNDKITLQSSFLTKILYKVESTMNGEVESWLSDPAVVTTDISKSMFNQGIEHLQEMSLKVPELFRTTNGYFVSYLKV